MRKAKASSVVPFSVDGIEVLLTKKRVKNITIRIKDPHEPVCVSAPYWVSKAVVEGFVRDKKSWIVRKQQALRDNPLQPPQKMSPDEVLRLKAETATAVEKLLTYWEPVIGVQAGLLAYRVMSSRWGSCNPSTGRICINVRLMQYPPECLEYVVVHELCHLIERGHGPRFKALMTRYLPDWQKRRALLR